MLILLKLNDTGFLDGDKLAYAFTLVRSLGVFVNADQVKDGELKSFVDLLAPRWKGIGSTFWPLRVARLRLGDGIMKQRLVEQETTTPR